MSKRKFNVYTDKGDYLGILAYNRDDASRYVTRITLGRAKIISVEVC